MGRYDIIANRKPKGSAPGIAEDFKKFAKELGKKRPQYFKNDTEYHRREVAVFDVPRVFDPGRAEDGLERTANEAEIVLYAPNGVSVGVPLENVHLSNHPDGSIELHIFMNRTRMNWWNQTIGPIVRFLEQRRCLRQVVPGLRVAVWLELKQGKG